MVGLPANPQCSLRRCASFLLSAGIAGLATAMLKLLLRLPPNLQTVRAFPIGLTQENMLAEPILRALYDVVSIPPVDKVCPCLQPAGTWRPGAGPVIRPSLSLWAPQPQPAAAACELATRGHPYLEATSPC